MTEDLWVKVQEIVESRLPSEFELSDAQLTGLQAAWEKKKYKDFYKKGFSDGYLSNVLIPVYALLSESFGVTVRKSNFREIIKDLMRGNVYPEELPKGFPILGTAPRIEFFVGREKEIEFIDNTYSQQKIIFIYGCEGIGKTALASEFFQKISKTDNYQKYIWYAPINDSIEVNVQEINKLLDSKKSSLSLNNFYENISINKVCIVIDAIDLWISSYLDETTSFIKRIVDLHQNSLILFTFRNSLDWFKHLEEQGHPVKSIKLSGLNVEATERLFKLRGIEDPRIGEIYDSIRGNPIAILDACKKIEFMNGEVAQYIKYKTLFLTKVSKERLDKVFNTESSKVKSRERHILFILMQVLGEHSVNKSAALDLVEEKTDYNLPEIIESMEILIDNSLISIDETNPQNLIKHDEVKGYIAQNPLNLFKFENIL